MSAASPETAGCFVSPAMEAKVVRLAVANEMAVKAVEGLVGLATTSDKEALLLGLVAHLGNQIQTLLEITSGFHMPVVVSFETAPPPPEEVN